MGVRRARAATRWMLKWTWTRIKAAMDLILPSTWALWDGCDFSMFRVIARRRPPSVELLLFSLYGLVL